MVYSWFCEQQFYNLYNMKVGKMWLINRLLQCRPSHSASGERSFPLSPLHSPLFSLPVPLLPLRPSPLPQALLLVGDQEDRQRYSLQWPHHGKCNTCCNSTCIHMRTCIDKCCTLTLGVPTLPVVLCQWLILCT